MEQQKAQYSDVASRKPKNVLSLQHDVKSTFFVLGSGKFVADWDPAFSGDTVYQVLPYAIQQLKGAGYKLVTLAECVGEAPYQHVGPPQSRTVSNFNLVCGLLRAYGIWLQSDWHC